MPKPVIWYLHHYAGAPSIGMSYRPYYLSREFDKHGYKSYIIGAHFHHLMKSPLSNTQQIHPQKIDDQDYIFIKVPRYTGQIKRILNMISYSWKIWRYQKQLIKLTGIPSVIIVSSAHPLHYFSGRAIAKRYNAKLIFEVRDLWPLSLVELIHLSPKHPLVLLLGYIEKKAYQQADYVVSLLPNAEPYMSALGLSPDRFVYISNGAIEPSVEETSTLSEEHQQLILNKKQQNYFLLGYVGAHGIPNSLDDLLHALILLKKEGIKHIHVFMVGRGREKNTLIKLAKDNQLDSITFLDAIPKNQVMSFLYLMDAVYLGWKNRQIYKYGISPNKLFDYMLSGKPILHAFNGPHDLVSENQFGITVEAENSNSIAEGIKHLATLPKEELNAMGNHGKDLVLSQFNYANLGKKYVELFS